MKDNCGQAQADNPGGLQIKHGAKAFPYIAITVLFAVCTLAVDPRGEFPLNDDWSYTRTAFRLAKENRLQVDEWSAPTLVGQALYGGALAKIFGASFLVLRLSTLALSCATLWLLWSLLRKIGVASSLAWIATLSWMFNPVWFCLSFTFMTEIPFLFLATLTLYFFRGYLSTDRWSSLAACGISLGYAFLIRQTAVLFMAPMTLVLLFAGPERRLANRIRSILIWGGAIAVVTAPYAIWSLAHGSRTPAAQRKFELLSHITRTQVVGNSFGLVFYLSFFLLPVLIFLLPALADSLKEGRKGSSVAAVICLTFIAGFGLCWFHTRYSAATYLPSRSFHAQMPFLLNVLYDTGLGPLTLDPTYYGKPPTPAHPHMWLLITALVALAFVCLGTTLVRGVTKSGRSESPASDGGMLLLCGLASAGIAVFEVVFGHLQEGGLFDRHILTATLPLLIVLICMHRGNDYGVRTRWGAAIAAALPLAAAAWFSVAGTHDYLAWNRARWDLGNKLLSEKVDPLMVSGGFEFNGWNNYDTFRSRGNIGKIYYWWYDRPEYVIAMEPQESYRTLDKREYYSWLHGRDFPVYLLRKDN